MFTAYAISEDLDQIAHARNIIKIFTLQLPLFGRHKLTPTSDIAVLLMMTHWHSETGILNICPNREVPDQFAQRSALRNCHPFQPWDSLIDSSISAFGHSQRVKFVNQEQNANSVDTDETAQDERSHLDLNCMQKYLSLSAGPKEMIFSLSTDKRNSVFDAYGDWEGSYQPAHPLAEFLASARIANDRMWGCGRVE